MPSPSDELLLEFTLNGNPAVVNSHPEDRLLDVLRYEFGLTGTKEGCGEGECGACTVFLDGMPVDSCLVPACQVRGRRVDTIESIDPGSLAMFLRCGATQCGACTPGVVMTACWMREHPELLERFSARHLMAGNLCRCTGYDGIIDGVVAAIETHPAEPPVIGPEGPATTARARVGVAAEGRTDSAGRVLMPSNLDEALQMVAETPNAIPVAGGTDLLVRWPEQAGCTEQVYVDLSGIDELRQMRWRDGYLELGALTTYWDVLQDDRAGRVLPLLHDAASQVGAIQVQARGTWAGNIANASPAADGVPVLMAYDAIVVLASTGGTREVALGEFYHGYKKLEARREELITSIRVPLRELLFERFIKVGARRAQAITKVGVTLTHSDSGWRVVASSVAPTVKRCTRIEQLLDGGGLRNGFAGLLEAIDADVSPIDDLRSTARYRRRVLARVIHAALDDESRP